jgi:hypothetical protein
MLAAREAEKQRINQQTRTSNEDTINESRINEVPYVNRHIVNFRDAPAIRPAG